MNGESARKRKEGNARVELGSISPRFYSLTFYELSTKWEMSPFEYVEYSKNFSETRSMSFQKAWYGDFKTISRFVLQFSGASPTKTTTQTCTRNMPWGSGLRAQVIKRETRERWLQEYNDSENFPLKFVSDTEVRCETCDTNFTAKKSTVKRHCESRAHCYKNGLSTEGSDDSCQHEDNVKAQLTCEPDIKEEFEAMEEDSSPVTYQSSESDKASGVTHEDSNQMSNVRGSDSMALSSSNDSQSRQGFLDIPTYRSRQGFPKKCALCEKVFSTSKPYLSHMRYQHKYGLFTCSKCKFKANFAQDLIEHMQQQNHMNELVICPCCKEEYDMTEIVSHYEECILVLKKEQLKRKRETANYKSREARGFSHEENIQRENELQIERSQKCAPQSPKKCSLCEKVLASYNSLHRHNKLVHHWGSFKCLKCSFGASFAKDILEHMKEQNHDDEPLVRCPSCKEKHHMTSIASHYENCLKTLEKESRTRMNKMRFNEKGEVEPYLNKDPRIFPRKCTFCDNILQNLFTYRKHIRFIHHGGNFTCLNCKILAVFAKDLVWHMEEEEHTDEPFVICPQCSDKYHMKDIVAHYEDCMKNAYKKENVIKYKICPTCGKTFGGSKYYQHLKIHLREREGLGVELPEFHYCDQCGKRFSTKQYLKNHMQIEHDNKEFECKTCNQTFKSSGKRVEHNIVEHSTDEKYNCKYCGKRFGGTAPLKLHLTYYHEAPKFKCQYCGKMFKLKQSLEGHERMHIGEKPFPCSICSESFTRSTGLAQHMRGVHKIAKRGGKVGWGHWGKSGRRKQEEDNE